MKTEAQIRKKIKELQTERDLVWESFGTKEALHIMDKIQLLCWVLDIEDDFKIAYERGTPDDQR